MNMVNYKRYMIERKDRLHDEKEKLSYLRSKLGLNRDGVTNTEAEKYGYRYSGDDQTNRPNEELMARALDAEYRDMESNHAAKKLAVQKAKAEMERDELEGDIKDLEKSDKKLSKSVKSLKDRLKELKAELKAESNPEDEDTATAAQEAPEGENDLEKGGDKEEDESGSETSDSGSDEEPKKVKRIKKDKSEDDEDSEDDENPLEKEIDLAWAVADKPVLQETRRPANLKHLFERLFRDKVIRDGKRTTKFKTDKAEDGYKVSVDNEGHAREVKMSPKEIVDRQRQQKKAQRKRTPNLKNMTRKRLRSMLTRRNQGLKDGLEG